MKFPAIVNKTLGTAHPVLKETDSGDIIDFYGMCSHHRLARTKKSSPRYFRFSIVEVAINELKPLPGQREQGHHPPGTFM